MNTREFFSLVLPESGIKYLAELRSFDKQEDGKSRTIQYFHHYPFEDLAPMAGAARDLDDEGRVVYFALAGYDEPVQATDKRTGQPAVTASGKPRMELRTQRLASSVKSLWADIDCSPEKAAKGQGYATKGEAAAALAAFCKATKTPAPLIVDSGNGLHCYWPLTREIKGAQWTQIALLWRAVVQHFGLRSDPARDIDVASVLRPVGTTNRKNGERKVRAVNDPAKVQQWSAGQWVQHITGLMKQHNIVRKAAAAPREASMNDDLCAAPDYPASSALEIAKHCSQIVMFYNARGDVSEPVWRAALGLLKHTVEGEDLAHEWSAGHPEYDEAQTQEKMDRWTAGPTTCEHFKGCNPDGCAGCRFDGKVKSPIQLGVKVPEENTTVAIETPAAGADAKVDLQLPQGFTLVDNKLAKYVTDAEGVTHRVEIVVPAFYIVSRVRDIAANSYSCTCVTQKPNGRMHYFTLPSSVIATNKFAEHLSTHEVFLMSSKHIEYVREYARESILNLAKTADEQRSTSRFGWNDDLTEFACGDTAVCIDGTEAPLTTASATELMRALSDRRGTVEAWAGAVNSIYNRAGMEPMQYAIASQFGSLLTPLTPSKSFKGCLLALTSVRSGIGKTTAAQFALSAFGSVSDLTISGKGGATTNALYATMSTLNSLPLLLDDFSDADQKFLSDLAYSVSHGKDRSRLNKESQLRVARTWAMSPIITANDNIGSRLSADGSNAEAQALRVLEIGLDGAFLPAVSPEDMRAAETTLLSNYGMAGLEFVRRMTPQRDALREEIAGWLSKIERDSSILAASQYRFFRGHIACTLTALRVMRDAGLVEFATAPIYKWVLSHCEFLATEIRETNASTTDEAFNAMVNAFGPQTIVTYGYGDGRGGHEDPLRPLRGEPVARMILGGAKVPPAIHNTLLISKAAVRQWCQERRVDWKHMMSSIERQGALLSPVAFTGSGDDRARLGRGTNEVTGSLRCYFIDMTKLQGGRRLTAVASPNPNADEPLEAAS